MKSLADWERDRASLKAAWTFAKSEIGRATKDKVDDKIMARLHREEFQAYQALVALEAKKPGRF